MMIIHRKGYSYKLSRIKLTAAISPVCACRSAPWNIGIQIDSDQKRIKRLIGYILKSSKYSYFLFRALLWFQQCWSTRFMYYICSQRQKYFFKLYYHMCFCDIAIKTQPFYHVKNVCYLYIYVTFYVTKSQKI